MLLDMNVKLRRGRFHLNTQLSVNSGCIGLLGKSGAGKSTLLGLIAGNLQPESGHIILDGKILFDSRKGIVMPREQRPIGAVLHIENTNLVESVHELLNNSYNRTLKQRRLFKLDYLIGLLELESILDKTLDLLSADECQRLALARSLLKSPKLLLLDDTFSSIGSAYRGQLLPILRRLQDDINLMVLYASQSLWEILALTDQLILLEQGKVLHSGSLREVAKHQGILSYLGIRQIDNILPVTMRVHDQSAGCNIADSYGMILALPYRPNLSIGSQTQVSIRANDIALSRHYIDGISIQNQIKGRICALIASEDSLIVQVDCGATLLVEITPSACRAMALHEGDSVYCLIKTHTIVYLSELANLPYQRIINHGDGYYYLGADQNNNRSLFNNLSLFG